VAAISPKEPRWIRNNPPIVNLFGASLGSPAIVGSLEAIIRVFRESGVLPECPWKVLGAFAIYHAWSIWVKNATGTMDHVLDHQVIEFRLCVWIWELCRDKRVDVLWCPELGVMVER
jgi:hypothetical protein